MQKKYNTETYIVKEICECGGEFVFDGIVLTSYPPKFPHTCNKCGKTVHLDREYPSAQTEIRDEVIEKAINKDIVNEKNKTTTCNLTYDDIGEFSSITVKPFKEEDIRCDYYFPLKDWVTREKNGELTVHTSVHEPWKEKIYGNEYWINGQFINNGEYLVGTVVYDEELLKKYAHLTWDDDPICIKTYSYDEMCIKCFGNGKN